MKIEIVKEVKVQTSINASDMGIAFADAAQEEQTDFIAAAVKEFNSWDKFNTDTQITRICDEILQSEHRREIESFMKRMMFFYKSIRGDKIEVTI